MSSSVKLNQMFSVANVFLFSLSGLSKCKSSILSISSSSSFYLLFLPKLYLLFFFLVVVFLKSLKRFVSDSCAAAESLVNCDITSDTNNHRERGNITTLLSREIKKKKETF